MHGEGRGGKLVAVVGASRVVLDLWLTKELPVNVHQGPFLGLEQDVIKQAQWKRLNCLSMLNMLHVGRPKLAISQVPYS